MGSSKLQSAIRCSLWLDCWMCRALEKKEHCFNTKTKEKIDRANDHNVLFFAVHTRWIKHFQCIDTTSLALAMPVVKKSATLKLVETIGSIFYPVIFIFPVPIFLYHIVYEKVRQPLLQDISQICITYRLCIEEPPSIIPFLKKKDGL
jgi:hypothetical protein